MQDGVHLFGDRHLDTAGMRQPTAAVVVKIPSTTIPCIPARISGNLRPRPVRHLRCDCGEPAGASEHRSPRPASPARVSALPPQATTSRVISANPRVISAAMELCPRPRPALTQRQSRIVFFSAPPSSTR